MKKIEAIIRRERLGAVRKALKEVGYPGMTVTEVKGHGRQGGTSQQSWRGEDWVEYLPKIKVEIVVRDEEVMSITQALVSGAHTGEIGDGKVFIYPIDHIIRVRTGEEGEIAV